MSIAYQLIGNELLQYQTQDVLLQMSKVFIDMVSRRTAPMKAKMTPQKKKPENKLEKAIAEVPAEGKKTSRRKTYDVLDQFHDVDFELTEECWVYLREIYHLSINPNRRCSFAQSLKNWSIELRQRPDQKCDFYYYHPSASRCLRSMVEVVYFFFNGDVPTQIKQFELA